MGSKFSWNPKPILGATLLILLGAVLFTQSGADLGKSVLSTVIGGLTDLKSVNLLKDGLPKEVVDHVKENVSQIPVKEGFIDANGLEVAYREVEPIETFLKASGQTFILLHGQAFSAKTWQETLPTLQTLGALGHRAVAVDLPGFGKTKSKPTLQNKGRFLAQLINGIQPEKRAILVSPSMSGSYSLELLFGFNGKLCGYVPVAPVGTGRWTPSQYEALSTPTLIVVGERDTALGQTSTANLVHIPTASNPQVFPNGRHPCYLDDPGRWHTLLHNFAKAIGETC